MTAQPVHGPAPCDPGEILRILPEGWREEFLGEYRAALDAAREVRRWASYCGAGTCGPPPTPTPASRPPRRKHATRGPAT